MKAIDIFGDTINFSYQGESKYNTRLGGICTIFTATLIFLMLGVRTIDFLGRQDREVSMYFGVTEPDSMFDLNELGLRFAVRKIKPEVGRVKAT